MNKLKLITSVEKAQLKEYIIADHPDVYNLLKLYPTSEYELNLADALIEVLRGPGSRKRTPLTLVATKTKIQEEDKQDTDESYQEVILFPSHPRSPPRSATSS